MKQHIIVKQLWELTKDKDDWDSITRFNTIAKIKFSREKTFQACCITSVKQITIGKMIEMLFKYHDDLINHPQIIKNELDEWCFYITVYGEDILVCYKNELVDCLWEAIKEII